LPFSAASLTRKALDTALLAAATAAGVRLERGRSVQSLSRSASDLWQATLDDGTTFEAPTAFLASGKHDLRGHSRPKDPHQWVAFKMYYRMSAAQTADLGDASELTLYAGGYGGIQPVEDGITNFCCVVQRKYFARAGLGWEGLLAKMQQDCPHLAMRLEDAEPLLEKPITVTHIPYGYLPVSSPYSGSVLIWIWTPASLPPNRITETYGLNPAPVGGLSPWLKSSDSAKPCGRIGGLA
jgi:hypothetical protein